MIIYVQDGRGSLLTSIYPLRREQRRVAFDCSMELTPLAGHRERVTWHRNSLGALNRRRERARNEGLDKIDDGHHTPRTWRGTTSLMLREALLQAATSCRVGPIGRNDG